MNSRQSDKQSLGRRRAQGEINALRWTQLLSPRGLTVLALLSLLMLSGLGVVHSTFRHRYAMHELQQLRSEQNQLDVQWGQLLIEQSTFALEGRIARKAEEELGMKLPDWSGVVTVQYE